MSRSISMGYRTRRMSRRCAPRSPHCGSGWAMRPARQERRLEVPPPADSKGARHEKEHDMKLTTHSGVTPPTWGSTMRRIVAAGVLVAMSLAIPKPTRAGRLGPDIIALFPKEIGEFAYADLKKARTLKWFPQLQ